MQKCCDHIINDRTGRPVVGARVTVTKLSGAAATLYSDNGTTALANNYVTTDSRGYFEFYAADDRYTLTITGSGIDSRIIRDIILEDPADGSAALAAPGGAELVGGTWFGGIVATVAALATSVGASLLGFIQAGIGAFQRSIQDRLREKVSVFDFMTEAQRLDVMAGTALLDVTDAIQRGLNYLKARGGGVLWFPAGVYLVGNVYTVPAGGTYLDQYMIDVSNTLNITLRGEGKASKIKLKDHFLDGAVDLQSNAHIFFGSTASGLTFDSLFFNLNGLNNLTPAGKTRNSIAIKIQGGDDLTARNCVFLNSGGTNVIAAGGVGDGFTVFRCQFINGGRGVTGNVNNGDFSFVYSEWVNTLVTDNVIKQENGPGGGFSGGIELHSSNSKASLNSIVNCEPGIWLASDPSPMLDVIVTANNFIDCNRGIAFWRGAALKNVSITANNITLKSWNGGSLGISIPFPVDGVFTNARAHGGVIENLTIAGNTIADNQTALATSDCFGIRLGSLKTAHITGNNLSGLNGIPILLSGSPFGMEEVSVSGNIIANCGRNTSGNGHEAIFIDLNGASTTPAASQFFAKNISLTGNKLSHDVMPAGSKAYAFAWPAGSMSNLKIKDNEVINFAVLWSGSQAFDYNFAQGVSCVQRKEFSAVAAPAAGTWTRGDVAWSVFQASDGAPVGWLCVATGTPGTWVPFGIAGAIKLVAQADSAAADVAALKTDFNALLAKLRAAKLMS